MQTQQKLAILLTSECLANVTAFQAQILLNNKIKCEEKKIVIIAEGDLSDVTPNEDTVTANQKRLLEVTIKGEPATITATPLKLMISRFLSELNITADLNIQVDLNLAQESLKKLTGRYITKQQWADTIEDIDCKELKKLYPAGEISKQNLCCTQGISPVPGTNVVDCDVAQAKDISYCF